MTKLQNVGGYGILAIPTLPAIIVFFHAIRGTLGGALLALASGKAERSQVHQPSCECPPTDFTDFTELSCCSFLPQNSQNSQNFLAVVSPTEFIDFTELSCCSFLPQNSQNSQKFLTVAFSHRIHRTHRSFLL